MLKDKKEALSLLKACKDQYFALDLFKKASLIRDENVGKNMWFSSGSGGLFACDITPTCAYCTFFTRKQGKLDDLLAAVKKLDALGLRHFHISGGTSLKKGYDAEIIKTLEEIKKLSSMEIEVNLGPSFKKETLKEFKDLGVESVTSSLEVLNEELFKVAKPGDSLKARKDLLKECDKLDIPLNSMILLGLGESDEDIIDHLFYLASFENFYKLRLSRFYPFPNTKFANHPRCSPWKLACVCAVARLIMPKKQISMAAGNDFFNDLPLFHLSGGGGELFAVRMGKASPQAMPGVNVHELKEAKEEIYVIDQREHFSQCLESFGIKATNETPIKKGK